VKSTYGIVEDGRLAQLSVPALDLALQDAASLASLAKGARFLTSGSEL
jgi:hypothetical protein